MQLDELKGAVQEMRRRGAVALPPYPCWPYDKAGLLEDCMADAFVASMAQLGKLLRVREGKEGDCWDLGAHSLQIAPANPHVPYART